MKKLLLIITATAMCCQPVFAEDNTNILKEQLQKSIVMFVNENQVFIGGEEKTIDENSKVIPFVENGRTLVPLRFIMEQFNGKVEWNNNTNEIKILIDKDVFKFQIDNRTVYINDNPITMEVAPKLLYERTFVPLRVISENVGKKLFYKNDVIVISDEKTDIESLSEEDQNSIVSSLKEKDFFTKTIESVLENSTEIKIDNFYKRNPISKFSKLKNTELILRKPAGFSDVKTTALYEKIKKNKLEIVAVNDSYFLDKENKLHRYTIKGEIKNMNGSPTGPLEWIGEFDYGSAGEKIVDFNAGAKNLITLNTDGKVLVSESNYTTFLSESEKEKLGYSKEQPVIVNRKYEELTDVQSVFGGDDVCFVIKNDGTLWGWGKNDFGQVGDGSKTDRKDPVLISGVSDVVFVSTADKHTLCITKDGSLWAWGKNADFQLGLDVKNSSSVPVKVTSISDVKYVATASDYTLAVKNDGTVWAAGTNKHQQLGILNIKQATLFTKVEPLADIEYVSAFAFSGKYESFAVTKTGELYSWGTLSDTMSPKEEPSKADNNLAISE